MSLRIDPLAARLVASTRPVGVAGRRPDGDEVARVETGRERDSVAISAAARRQLAREAGRPDGDGVSRARDAERPAGDGVSRGAQDGALRGLPDHPHSGDDCPLCRAAIPRSA